MAMLWLFDLRVVFTRLFPLFVSVFPPELYKCLITNYWIGVIRSLTYKKRSELPVCNVSVHDVFLECSSIPKILKTFYQISCVFLCVFILHNKKDMKMILFET